MKTFFSFVVIMSFAFGFYGCGPAARLKRADKNFESGQYYAAVNKYKRLYSKFTAKEKDKRAHIAFNMGECNRILNQPNAEQNYSNALRNGFSDSIIYMRYAQVLHRSGNYKEAEKNYNIYLKSHRNNMQAQNGSEISVFADKLKKQPTPYNVKLFTLFNYNRCHNYAPAYQSTDGDIVYFTTDRALNKKPVKNGSSVTGLSPAMMYSARKNAAGNWEKPSAVITENVQNQQEDGVCSFTSDGNTMYFTRSRLSDANSNSGTEIFSRKRAGGTWTIAKKVNLFSDSTISVAHPAISPDGSTLVFVSDARDGIGGKDLWEAKMVGDEFTGIRNMGREINTEGDEMFPSFRYDGTLYFASNGWPGLGGLDIFKATKISESTGWIVENMGVPINSNADDFGITFESRADKGFFSSNRNEYRGHDMIYSFELPVYEFLLEGKVTDETQTPVSDAVIRLVSNSGINTKVQTRKDGTYRIKIDKDIDCVILAAARGYLNGSAKISTTGAKQSKTFKQDFVLQRLFKPIQLENIFYDFGKWTLTPASEVGLNALVKILTDNPNITIEIGAHTDFVGNNEANKELSAKRAQSVVDYLIKSGIKADRLTAIGYGEEKPVTVDANLVAKYSFLKENEILTEDYIKTLTHDQQETVNQINRRTEFRVLKTTYK